MKIQILSDLHNEFEQFMPSQAASEADVVVLAGDIHVKGRGVEWARNVFSCPVIYVLGNHEYFREHIDNTLEKMRAASCERVRVLDNEAWIINGVRFLGATCWTDYSSTGNAILAKYEAQRGLNDYRKIRMAGYRKVLPDDLALRNQLSLAWLRERLAEPFEGQTVVVTHHAPSLISMGHPPLCERSELDRWRVIMGDSSIIGSTDIKLTDLEVPHIAAAYANNWESLMGGSIALWVHGHVHRAADYTINGTRIMCNPRGYPKEDTGFNPDLLITVER
jgi:predicted phosphodiesterase/phage tail protein X